MILISYNLICFFSDTSQNTNLPSAITELSTVPDPFDTKLKVCTQQNFIM